MYKNKFFFRKIRNLSEIVEYSLPLWISQTQILFNHKIRFLLKNCLILSWENKSNFVFYFRGIFRHKLSNSVTDVLLWLESQRCGASWMPKICFARFSVERILLSCTAKIKEYYWLKNYFTYFALSENVIHTIIRLNSWEVF